jgi:hypothetical protein
MDTFMCLMMVTIEYKNLENLPLIQMMMANGISSHPQNLLSLYHPVAQQIPIFA